MYLWAWRLGQWQLGWSSPRFRANVSIESGWQPRWSDVSSLVSSPGGGAVTAGPVTVHHVVVQQGEVVHQLDGDRRTQRRGRGASDGLGRQQDQRGTDRLATARSGRAGRARPTSRSGIRRCAASSAGSVSAAGRRAASTMLPAPGQHLARGPPVRLSSQSSSCFLSLAWPAEVVDRSRSDAGGMAEVGPGRTPRETHGQPVG